MNTIIQDPIQLGDKITITEKPPCFCPGCKKVIADMHLSKVIATITPDGTNLKIDWQRFCHNCILKLKAALGND